MNRAVLGLFFIFCAVSALSAQSVEMVDAVTPLEQEQGELAINLANSLAKEKRYVEATQAYKEFLRIFPQNLRRREARENLARIYEKRQRYDLAIRQYEAQYRELGVSPLALLYHLESARLYEVTGDEQSAVAIYKEINRLDPASDAAAKARLRIEAINLLQKAGESTIRPGASTQEQSAGAATVPSAMAPSN